MQIFAAIARSTAEISSLTSLQNSPVFLGLKTNIRDERVCSTKTSGNTLTPKHSSPLCVTEWGVSGVTGQANWFENLNCRSGHLSLFACPLRPLPSTFGETGQGNGVWGSAYCSASLHNLIYSWIIFFFWGGGVQIPIAILFTCIFNSVFIILTTLKCSSSC